MNDSSTTLLMHGSQKIRSSHHMRLACIYIRQSSPSQVRDNKESQINQYRLVESAQALGWSATTIQIIDADLGISGRNAEGRLGFQDLINQVSLGKVGIIFGYEVSRLARNNADWYHLLNIAALHQTLVADNDGIYDPNLPNDRLLLGLKGAMSEFELHSIRQRMDAGRINKIKRGEYRQPLPTGYLRLKEGTVVKDPDQQVRQVIEVIFAQFAEYGSVSKVTRYLRKHNILLPRRQYGGLQHGELLWKPPAYSALHAILTNPAYAGAFAHGRSQVDPAQHFSSKQEHGRVRKPIEEWVHLQQNVYPAYIAWEQFLANQERIHQNYVQYDKNRQGPQGAAREGKALLQGLVWCGLCGGRLCVRYTQTAKYACEHLPKNADQGSCLHTVAYKVDEVVVNAFFQAIQPAQLDVLAALLTHHQQEQQQLERLWHQRLERARYDAALTERRYRTVDPDNRLVAATLERQWEEQLRLFQETQTAYDDFRCQQTSAPPLSPQLQTQFRQLCDTLPTLWPQLPNDHKKLLLRSLIAQVILTSTEPNQLEVKIVWVSGHYSCLTLQRSAAPQWAELRHYPQLLERIHQLWQQGLDDQEIANQLNAEGFSAYYINSSLSCYNVRNLRLKQGWSVRPAADQIPPIINGCYTPRGLAIACNTTKTWIMNRIHDRTIDPALVSRHPHQNCQLIQASPELIEQLRLLAANTKRRNRKSSPNTSVDAS